MRYLSVLWVKNMNKKLRYLTKISLGKKIKTKWFLIANLLFVFLIMALVNLDTIVEFFGGDFNDVTSIYFLDESGYEIESEFAQLMEQYEEELSVYSEVKTIESEEKFLEVLEDEEDAVLVSVFSDSLNYIRAKIVSNEEMDIVLYQAITGSLDSIKIERALLLNGIDTEVLENINRSVEIEREILDSNNSESDIELMMSIVFPILFLPVFMLTMFLVQMIGAEINEEKSTRGMEIIISNVSPKTHFLSKLIAGNCFVLLQGFLLLVYVVLAVVVRVLIIGGMDFDSLLGSSGLDVMDTIENLGSTGNLGVILLLSLVLIVLTFIGYSLLSAITASMTTSMEDYQQVQTPIVLVGAVGYYLAMMASMFQGSVLIRILSYVPFLSTMLSPAMLMLGQIGILDVLISIMIMIGVLALLIKYGQRIYKVGILNYSSSHIWKKMFVAARKS